MSDNSEDKKDEKEKKDTPPPTIIEWIIRGVCFSLVLGLIGFFVYCGLQNTEKPCLKFDISSAEVEQRNGMWMVPVSITNDGDSGIQNITIDAVLKKANKEITQQLALPLLGAKEATDAVFFYKEKPELDNLEFEIVSFILP